jgi:hypothetical protein
MQYLLTQEEHAKLTENRLRSDKQLRDWLQDLCSKVADHMPVKAWNWKEGDTLLPYGCVLTTRNEYCDDCPVRSQCPNEFKQYSK